MERIIVKTMEDLVAISGCVGDYVKRAIAGETEMQFPFRDCVVYMYPIGTVFRVRFQTETRYRAELYFDCEQMAVLKGDERPVFKHDELSHEYSADNRFTYWGTARVDGANLEDITLSETVSHGLLQNERGRLELYMRDKKKAEESINLKKAKGDIVKIVQESLYVFLCLSAFSAMYKETVVAKRRVVGEKKPSHGNKKGKKNNRTMYVREYVYDSEMLEPIRRGTKHRAPDHEFGVRGHWRRYQSGKTVWVKAHTRCKGRGEAVDGTYIAKVGSGHGKLVLPVTV